LAYADDVCVFLSNFTDFESLQFHLHAYGRVSNAKINIDKTEAIFLNGRSTDEWINFLALHNITSWHDRHSSNPLRYLGFPVISSPAQRQIFENKLLNQVKHRCALLSQYKLPLRGRVTVVNSLVLSTLWYFLRLITLPNSFFQRLRSVIAQFINTDIRPPFAYAHMCIPLSQGGLGLIDSQAQQRSLQVRWVENLLDSPPDNIASWYLWDYLCRFHSGDAYTMLGLFLPKLRGNTDSHLGCFVKTFFQTFDSFPRPDIADVECFSMTLLHFPLGEPL
jgi:hypothetical protein